MSRMNLFKSKSQNLLHYVTSVTFRRIPLFRLDKACELFIDAMEETRRREPFKLLAYVIMPDHVHLLLNPQALDIRLTMNRLKGRSARLILDWLAADGHSDILGQLVVKDSRSARQTHAVWQKGFSSIDIVSEKFVSQKMGYIHANPVRADLCDHPAKWKWSSYAAFLPHAEGSVPIEPDTRGFWNYDEQI